MAGNRPDQRKKWILENQALKAIYMNGSKAGDVNPYFACMAALGASGRNKNAPLELKQSKKLLAEYLDWHTGVFTETDGKMGIYRKEGGNLFIKKKADSKTDILVCTFFLWENIWKRQKVQTCWNPGKMNQPCIKKIQSLMQDGITQVSEENATVYLMDNLEVWKGLSWSRTCRTGRYAGDQ